MNKTILTVLTFVFLYCLLLCGCKNDNSLKTDDNSINSKKDSSSIVSNYAHTQNDETFKAIPGYKEYVNDRNTGNITSFCGTVPSVSNNKKARAYYKKNVRQSGNYLITNYLDGICINKVVDIEKWDYKIPEQIEGLPVVKLGCWLDGDSIEPFVVIDQSSYSAKEVQLSKFVKYIDSENLDRYWLYIYYSVDKTNPYYTTDENLDALYAIENGEKKSAYNYDYSD
jgi:hypothetical protein